MRQARITQESDTKFVLQCGYDAAFLDMFKFEVPGTRRKWVPEKKIWVVSLQYEQLVRDLLYVHGFQVVGHTTYSGPHSGRRAQEYPPPRDPPREPPRARATANGAWAQEMFAALPEPLRQSAYRALCKVLHPDTGGDAAAMTALNTAYRAVKKG